MSSTGVIRAAVEIIPLRGLGNSGNTTGVSFRDIKEINTNKSVSQPGAGNFTVTLGLAHGDGLQSQISDNDVIKIYAQRGGDPTELPTDMIFMGQLDRITRTARPDYEEWSLRGKCMTKQFLTNLLYTNLYGQYEDPDTGQLKIGVIPEIANLQQIATNILGCDQLVTLTESGTGAKVAGLSLQEFLEKFIWESPWVEPDLLTGAVIDAEHLLLRGESSPSFSLLYEVIEGLADRPFVYWYVDERGVFHFKPWHWRDASPNFVVGDDEYLNDNTSTADMKVIAGAAVTPDQTLGGAPFAGWAIHFDPVIGARYGTRFMRFNNAKYIYTYPMAQRRAVDHVQLQFLGRIESQVAVRGDSRWLVDHNVYVQRLGGYFYCDSVQHRLKFEKESVDWVTTLGLTHGRATADAYADKDAANASIIADISSAGVDFDKINRLLKAVNTIPEVTRLER